MAHDGRMREIQTILQAPDYTDKLCGNITVSTHVCDQTKYGEKSQAGEKDERALFNVF